MKTTDIENQVFINTLPPRKVQIKPRLYNRALEKLIPKHSCTKLKGTKTLKNVYINFFRTVKLQLCSDKLSLLIDSIGTTNDNIHAMTDSRSVHLREHIWTSKVVRVQKTNPGCSRLLQASQPRFMNAFVLRKVNRHNVGVLFSQLINE